MKRLILSLFILLSFVLGYSFHYLKERNYMPLVHKLKFPLMLAGGEGLENHSYILPIGTSLYFDQSFPEGFSRYKIYVNIEGILLESKESTEKFWLDPMHAFPIKKEQLKKLLKDYPLTKNELKEILNSNQISKEDIKELLTEYNK